MIEANVPDETSTGRAGALALGAWSQNFIEEVHGDDPELASYLRIEEREQDWSADDFANAAVQGLADRRRPSYGRNFLFLHRIALGQLA